MTPAPAPRVSVLLPAWNRAATLARAIASVLAQAGVDLELIVADDGSTDETIAVARAVRDPRVRVLALGTHLGAAAARNRAAAIAHGSILAFQDSDDEWLPGMLASLVATLERSGAAVAYGRAVGDAPVVNSKGTDIARTLLAGNHILLQAAIVRREAFVAAGEFDEVLPRLQDWDLWLRLARDQRFAACDVEAVHIHRTYPSIGNDEEALRVALARVLDQHAASFAGARADHGRHLRHLAALHRRAGNRAGARAAAMRALRVNPGARGALSVAAALAAPRGKPFPHSAVARPATPATPPPLPAVSRDETADAVSAMTARGGRWLALAQGGRLLLSLASLMVLARLLPPGDFGLVAIASAVTGFLLLFRDLGLGQAAVQARDLTPAAMSAFFWTATLAGTGAGLLAAAVGPLVARFYGEPTLAALLAALASALPLQALTSPHEALLRRSLRFRALATIDFAAGFAGAGAAIAAAWLGAGIWALTLTPIVGAAVALAASWYATGWLPGAPSLAAARPWLGFGGNMTGFAVLNYLARNLDDLLVGKAFGATTLGLYSRAYALLLLPMRVLSAPVGAATAAGLARVASDPDRFRRLYLRALGDLATLALPVSAALLVLAEEAVATTLGPAWSEAAPVFRLLGLSLPAQVVASSAGWILVAGGRGDKLLRWGVFAALVIVIAFLVGLPFGIRGVATSYALAVTLLVWPCLRYATAGTAITPRAALAVAARPLVPALIAAVAAMLARSQLADASLASRAGAALATFAVTYIALVAATPSGRASLRGILSGASHDDAR